VDVLASVTGAWAVVMALAPLLQVRRMLATRSARSVSVGYFALLSVGFALWVGYGASKHELVLVVPNSVAFVVNAATIVIALHFRREAEGPRQGGASLRPRRRAPA
jgi:MtN3 and saliva related transmembrane protein